MDIKNAAQKVHILHFLAPRGGPKTFLFICFTLDHLIYMSYISRTSFKKIRSLLPLYYPIVQLITLLTKLLTLVPEVSDTK